MRRCAAAPVPQTERAMHYSYSRALQFGGSHAELKGRCDEAAFQRYVRADLRRYPLIGALGASKFMPPATSPICRLHGNPIEGLDTLISSVDQCLTQRAS